MRSRPRLNGGLAVIASALLAVAGLTTACGTGEPSGAVAHEVSLRFVERNAQGFAVFVREQDQARMVLVPSGELAAGNSERAAVDEYSPHKRVAAYLIDECEVSRRQVDNFYRWRWLRPWHEASWPLSEASPATGVSWRMAERHCQAAGARLPSPEEWEYAARGPSGQLFPWGDEWPPLPGVANLADETSRGWFGGPIEGYQDGYLGPWPANGFAEAASWCGVLNLAGNVAEWCSGDFDAQGHPMTSQAPSHMPNQTIVWRVQMGSCFTTSRREETVSPFRLQRGHVEHDGGSTVDGFRCAMDVPDDIALQYLPHEEREQHEP